MLNNMSLMLTPGSINVKPGAISRSSSMCVCLYLFVYDIYIYIYTHTNILCKEHALGSSVHIYVPHMCLYVWMNE